MDKNPFWNGGYGEHGQNQMRAQRRKLHKGEPNR